MGNQSSLQGQVKRFRKEASDAIEQRDQNQKALEVLGAMYDESRLQVSSLSLQLQQARAIVAALAHQAEGQVVTVLAESLQLVADGVLAGVEFDTPEDGSLVITAAYGATEDEAEGEEE